MAAPRFESQVALDVCFCAAPAAPDKTVVRPGLKFLVESGFAPVYVRHMSN